MSHKKIVILMHGITGGVAEMEPLQRLLEQQGHTVINEPLAGHAAEGGTCTECSLRHTTQSEYLASARALLQHAHTLQAKEDRPLLLVGQSFGALLALGLAHQEATVSALFLIAPPFALKSRRADLMLSLCSYLPEWLLAQLPMIKKQERDYSRFMFPRVSLKFHQMGALARMFAIRRAVLKHSKELTIPIFVALDPNDHHLPPTLLHSVEKLFPRSSVETHSYPGGEHELFIGPRSQEVCNDVAVRINSHAS
jgi:esterase/lipase